MLTNEQLRLLGDLCRYPGGIYATSPQAVNGHERPTNGAKFDLCEMGLTDLIERRDPFGRYYWVSRVNDRGRVTFKLLTGGRCITMDGRVVF